MAVYPGTVRIPFPEGFTHAAGSLDTVGENPGIFETLIERDSMKKAIFWTLMAAGLAGCATSPINLTEAQKKQVSDGQAVMLTDSQEDYQFQDMVETVNKSNVKNGIFVCATPINKPTDKTPCYPNLSAYIGTYFEKHGVKLSKSREGADAIVYASVTYDFVNVFSYDGDDYRAKIMDNLEKAIADGNGAVLTMNQLPGEEFYKSDQASVDAANKKAKIEGTAKAVGYAAVAIASVLMGQPGGGAQASEAIRGFGQSGGNNSGAIDKKMKGIMINLHGKNLAGKVMDYHRVSPIAFTYAGPVKATTAFSTLFPEALDITVKRFIFQKTS